ncbi:hypothetical protein MMC07_009379 [Pseudocyphellaria aurata]|nr:hypothetical protein [Pseudocyphellaria aurata]
MDKVTFSSLPAEVHVGIAEYCDQKDLFNLCLVSKSMNESCIHVLYRHIDLNLRVPDHAHAVHNILESFKLLRQTREIRMKEGVMKEFMFASTLRKRMELAKHVRSYKGKMRDSFRVFRASEEALWNGLKLLTNLRHVEVDFRAYNALNDSQIPRELFSTVTSLAMIGHLEVDPDRSIVNAVDPAILTRLSFTMVHFRDLQWRIPGDYSRDNRRISYGATAGLLTSLMGQCSSLRSLTLRRIYQVDNDAAWYAAAENVSYAEYASFLCSVQSTLEHFTYEQTARWRKGAEESDAPTRYSDIRFRRFLLPAVLVARTWPCITTITIYGVRTPDEQPALIGELAAGLRPNIKIVVQERGGQRQQGGDMVEVFEEG